MVALGQHSRVLKATRSTHCATRLHSRLGLAHHQSPQQLATVGSCFRPSTPGEAWETILLAPPTSRRVGGDAMRDAQADVPWPKASGATCVQKLDGSRDSAIHTKYRISLRSSSMREPRYPLPRVVVSNTTRMLHPPHTEAGARGRQIHFKFLGATCAGVWFKRVEGEGGRQRACFPPALDANSLFLNVFAGRLMFRHRQ